MAFRLTVFLVRRGPCMVIVYATQNDDVILGIEYLFEHVSTC